MRNKSAQSVSKRWSMYKMELTLELTFHGLSTTSIFLHTTTFLGKTSSIEPERF